MYRLANKTLVNKLKMKQKSFQANNLGKLDDIYNKFATEHEIAYRTINSVAIPTEMGTIEFEHFMFIQYNEAPNEIWEWCGGAFLDREHFTITLDDKTTFNVQKSNCIEKKGTYGNYWAFQHDGNDYNIRVKRNGSLGVKIRK